MLSLFTKEKDTIFFNPLLFQCLLEAAELVSSLMKNLLYKWVGGKDTDIAGQKVSATRCGTDKHLVKLPPATSQKAGLPPTDPMTPAESVGKTQDGGACWLNLPVT